MAQLASMQQPAEESSSDEKEVGDKKEQVSEKSAEERRALPERGQVGGSGVQDKMISSSVTFMRQLSGVVCLRELNGFAQRWTPA